MSTLRVPWIAWHELRASYRDGRVSGAAAIFVLLAGLAVFASAANAREYERVQASAQSQSYEQWLSQGAKNPHSAAHFGVYAFRPLGALSLFDPGVHAFQGTSVYLEAHKANDLRDAPADDAPSLTRLGRSSAAALLQTLLPLIVFVLVAPSIAGERERGTLALLLAQGVSLRAVFWGKAMALGVLFTLVLFCTGAASLAGARVAHIPVSAERAMGLLIGYGLYTFILVGIALTVSAAARTSRSALVSLLAIWSFVFLAGPRIAAYVARIEAPLPLASAEAAALERDLDAEGEDRRDEELLAATFRRYGVRTEEELPIDFRGLSLQTSEEHDQAIYEQHRQALRARFAAQEAWLDGASLGLVGLAMARWSEAVSGTDRRHVDDFVDAAERHRRELVRRMNTYLIDHKPAKDGATSADEALWSQVAPFQYVPPAPKFAFAYAWSSLAVLFVWCLGVLAASEWVLRRHGRLEVAT
ncbi:ABC transporter permease subunit [Pendulispora albinea]|uniref:ABC transporter permease n=1 Tax=Pendulispora albinea TaxID=2741071 RepID=A0ABZ2M098_9BACT